MRTTNVIIISIFFVIALAVFYCKYFNVEIVIGNTDPSVLSNYGENNLENFALIKRTEDPTDMNPDYYDYYDYNYYDWIPVMVLGQPRYWPEPSRYAQIHG